MKTSISLEDLILVKSCPMHWRQMDGNDQVRVCHRCNRKVYNISNMTREEAERVIRMSGGRLCAQFYRRKKDGMIMTAPCGFVGKVKRRLSILASGVMGLFGMSLFITPVYAGQSRTMTEAALVKRYSRLRSMVESEQNEDVRRAYQSYLKDFERDHPGILKLAAFRYTQGK
jgi:hypothetical protein